MRFNKCLFSLLLVIGCVVSSWAADFTISGKLSLFTGEVPVPFYRVEAKSENGQYIGNTRTNFSGQYAIQFDIPDGETVQFVVSVVDICSNQQITKETATTTNNATVNFTLCGDCLLYTSPSPRDKRQSRMPSSA